MAAWAVHDGWAGLFWEGGEVLEVGFGEFVDVCEEPALGSTVLEPLLERGGVAAVVHGATDTCEELVEWAGTVGEHVPFFGGFGDMGREEEFQFFAAL